MSLTDGPLAARSPTVSSRSAVPKVRRLLGCTVNWGYGKSSVLNFIKHHLEQEHAGKVVLFEFNPWFFTSQEELLAAFFAGLAARLEQSLGSVGGDVGGLLKKYSGLFGLIPVVGSGASKLAEQLGNELSADSLQNQRERVFEMMRCAKRSVIVLIDDLDRLDGAEIMTMLEPITVPESNGPVKVEHAVPLSRRTDATFVGGDGPKN